MFNKYWPDPTLQKADPNQTSGWLSVSTQGPLWVYYGGPRADPNQTQSGHRKQALISEADP